jgi:hypothetical protein
MLVLTKLKTLIAEKKRASKLDILLLAMKWLEKILDNRSIVRFA